MVPKAYIWSAVEQVGRQGIRFALSIVLARLLSPAEYGLMGMMLVFLLIAQAFVDCGFSMGLVQRKDITLDDETSIFWLNVVAGVVMAGLVCAVSPLVARFYDQPILVPMLCVSSVGMVIGSLGIVQTALLTRQMDFRTQAKVTIASTVLSGAVGITMAWRGMGVWSLVGQSLAQTMVGVTLLWKLSDWRPAGRFRWATIRAIWPFSSRLLASGVMNTAFENSYALVIGKLYSPADLGFYTRASTLTMLPASTTTTVIGRVTLPVFSRMQEDADGMRQKFRRILRVMASCYFPAMVCLAAMAEPLVRVLLTDKWLPCVPYFQVLCFSGMLYPVHALHLNVLMAQGRSDLFFRLEIVKKVLTVLALLATYRYGISAMVWGMLVNSLICLVINGYYTRRLLRYGWQSQARDLGGVFLIAVSVGGCVWLSRVIGIIQPIRELAMQALLASILAGIAFVTFRASLYREAWAVMSESVGRVWGDKAKVMV